MEANVIYDHEHDCYLLEFDEKTMKQLGWNIGDTLVWCVDGEEIYLRKYEEPTNERSL